MNSPDIPSRPVKAITADSSPPPARLRSILDLLPRLEVVLGSDERTSLLRETLEASGQSSFHLHLLACHAGTADWCRRVSEAFHANHSGDQPFDAGGVQVGWSIHEESARGTQQEDWRGSRQTAETILLRVIPEGEPERKALASEFETPPDEFLEIGEIILRQENATEPTALPPNDSIDIQILPIDPAAAEQQLRQWIRERLPSWRNRRLTMSCTDVTRQLSELCQETTRNLEQSRQQLQSEQAVIRRSLQSREGTDLEPVRRVWEDGFQESEISLVQRVRERLFPATRIVNRIQNLREDLVAEDLLVEHEGKSVRLRATQELKARARGLIDRSLREVIEEDCEWLRGEIERIRIAGEETLPELLRRELRLSADLPDVASVLADLQRRVAVEIRYTGEIPRRTLFDWLGQGRRPVFAVTMLLSIFGTALGFGSGRAAIFAPMLAMLFIVGAGWGVIEFRSERRRYLDRELNRFRDAVEQELRRTVEMLLRDWQEILQRKLREIQRDWQRTANDSVRSVQAKLEWDAEQRSAGLQAEIRRLDGLLRELETCRQQIRRLRD